MRNFFASLKNNPWLMKRLVVVGLLVGVGVGGFYYGRKQGAAKAGDPNAVVDPQTGLPVSSASGRVVAYLYGGKVAVSREELGEYLIARLGEERLDFMLNRKIVEIECAKKGIYVAESEIDARLDQDLWAYGGSTGTKLTVKEFENSILRKWNKTMYEWREDVIRPKLMMEKLVNADVQVTKKDIDEGFEARYGPKVECRMIVLDGRDKSVCQKVWESASKSREKFLEEARKQFIQQLAAQEGKVPPIHKHVGDKVLEDAAFRLKPGDISGLLDMKDGTCVILMCEKHLPADASVRFETVQARLIQEVKQQRVAQRLPEEFAAMRLRASPRPVLDNRGMPPSNLNLASFASEKETKVDVPPAPVPQPIKIDPKVGATPLQDSNPLPAPKVDRPAEKTPTPMPTSNVERPMGQIVPNLSLPKFDNPNEKK